MAYSLTLLPPGKGNKKKDYLKDLCFELEDSGSISESEPGIFSWMSGQTKIQFSYAPDSSALFEELEVSIPYGAPNEEVREGIIRLIRASEKTGLRVFDPQLGRSVEKNDLVSIIGKFNEASSYHLELSGVSEDLRQGIASSSNDARKTFFSPRLKAFSFIIIFFVVIYIFFRLLIINPVLDALSPDSAGNLEPPPGPPPGWLDTHHPVGCQRYEKEVKNGLLNKV